MFQKTLLLTSIVLCSTPAFAETVTLESLPATEEEFIALRNKLATTPQGGAAMFALALNMYSDGHPQGAELLGLVVDMSKLSGKEPTAMKDFKDRNKAKPYIAYSMIQGTSPENGYTRPAMPWTVSIARVMPAKEDDVRVYVHTTGAESSKPLQLKKNDKGIWKAAEWSSFQGNCRAPIAKKVDER
ncbi:MAG: hypothetical protein IT381_01570 [Deltaproteobacteria bacterium]|nr:hypothetical protein [Deltaproteobacteria bacterium]